MKIIIFKLFEFSSTLFSKSQQLKDINIVSLTEGFELNINIFESISNNVSHTINYTGNTSTIKICLRKNKLTIGIGQMNIINKRQNIKIYPTNNNPNKKLITLILFCYNKKDFSEKYLESYKSPDKTQYYKYFNNSNNSNTNNTSSFSISSLIIKNNKTPLNKRQNFIINQKNKSQTNLKNNSQKKLFTGLTQNSVYSFNTNIFKYDKDHNITIYSDNNNNTKSQLSGSISCYSNNFFSEKKDKNKKLYSPAIYSYPFNKNNNRNKINENKKRNFQNKSMINSLIISNLDLKIDDDNKFTHVLNLDKMNKQIDEYIFDKTFEDVLQNDLPIISQEDKQFLYYDEYNSNKYKKMITDFFLLYNEENIKKVNDSEIKLETHFMIEKIYELMHEYYKEYYDFDNQNKYLIGVIKNFGYRYNNLLKKKTNLKIKIYKNKIKKDLYPKKKKLKYYMPKVNKINNELKILNNINQITINNNKMKNLRNIFLNIIQKNRNKINEKQNKKLKDIGITIIEDKYISDQKNNNNLNKKIINKNEDKEIDNKRKNSIDLTSKKYTYSNLNINEKNNYRFFRNYKIKVKSKVNNIKAKNIITSNNVNSVINPKDFPFNKKKLYKNQNI